MKMQQQPEFHPITLTIETGREAEIIWAMVREYQAKGPVEIALAKKIVDWFSNAAQLCA